jgi:DNA-binding transcriptional MerR regulator
MTSIIPNKSNFKFQELTPITGVKPYVIRYWETEFPEIAPISSEKGEKIYARKDVEAILKVKKLLFEDKMTIPEAKMRMSSQESEVDDFPPQHEISVQAAPDVKPLLKESLALIRQIKARRNW